MSTLHRQQLPLQWKQIFLLTTPSSFLGCASFIQPGAWVPQRCVGTQEFGILVPASPTNWCHFPIVFRFLTSHSRKLFLKLPEARFASLSLTFTMHSAGAIMQRRRCVNLTCFKTNSPKDGSWKRPFWLCGKWLVHCVKSRRKSGLF